eukprot:TRINITY_DN7647_c0_g1_i1.p1 TRINITY_DN7647_c0_g1~~TRINITY_DN7647_c0_g1_i1.p1  ORF type:complete len:843 (-),score=164.18 TRINITY_DN7647_c0_g1_i1:63-2591(-)
MSNRACFHARNVEIWNSGISSRNSSGTSSSSSSSDSGDGAGDSQAEDEAGNGDASGSGGNDSEGGDKGTSENNKNHGTAEEEEELWKVITGHIDIGAKVPPLQHQRETAVKNVKAAPVSATLPAAPASPRKGVLVAPAAVLEQEPTSRAFVESRNCSKPSNITRGCAEEWPAAYNVLREPRSSCLTDGQGNPCLAEAAGNGKIIAARLRCLGTLNGPVNVSVVTQVACLTASWAWSTDGIKWALGGDLRCAPSAAAASLNAPCGPKEGAINASGTVGVGGSLAFPAPRAGEPVQWFALTIGGSVNVDITEVALGAGTDLSCEDTSDSSKDAAGAATKGTDATGVASAGASVAVNGSKPTNATVAPPTVARTTVSTTGANATDAASGVLASAPPVNMSGSASNAPGNDSNIAAKATVNISRNPSSATGDNSSIAAKASVNISRNPSSATGDNSSIAAKASVNISSNASSATGDDSSDASSATSDDSSNASSDSDDDSSKASSGTDDDSSNASSADSESDKKSSSVSTDEWAWESNSRNRWEACTKVSCAVIVDTGSNIIGGPRKEMIALSKLLRVKPDCSNFHSLPDITLQLGGYELRLPASGYVMKIKISSRMRNGDGGEDMSKLDVSDRLRQWRVAFDDLAKRRGIDLRVALGLDKGRKGPFPTGDTWCMPAFVPVDVRTQLGPLWVIGRPIFVNYYVRWSWPQAADSPSIFFKETRNADACRTLEAAFPETFGGRNSDTYMDESDGSERSGAEINFGNDDADDFTDKDNDLIAWRRNRNGRRNHGRQRPAAGAGLTGKPATVVRAGADSSRRSNGRLPRAIDMDKIRWPDWAPALAGSGL